MRLLKAAILLFSFWGSASAQEYKLIGTSTNYYKDVLVADSLTTFVLSFDNKGRPSSEFRIMRDSTGTATDTFLSLIDSNGGYYYYHSKTSETWTSFDSFGNEIYYKGNYTYESNGKTVQNKLEQEHKLGYNKRGKLKTDTIISEERNSIDQIMSYKHFLRYEFSSSKLLFSLKCKNKFGNVSFQKYWSKFPGKKATLINHFTRTYTRKGNLKSFKQYNNGKLTKKTKHYYKNGIETRREEDFFNLNIQVITYFIEIE